MIVLNKDLPSSGEEKMYILNCEKLHIVISRLQADERITKRVKEALNLAEIKLLDHIIVNRDEEFATIDV